MAMWDATARACGLSLVELLGGTPGEIAVYGAVGFDGVAGSAKVAERWADRGVRAVKTKVGYPTVREDVDVIKAIRDAVGDDVRIMVDYNQCLTVSEALERCRALDDPGLTWIEEPTLAHDFLLEYADWWNEVIAEPLQLCDGKLNTVGATGSGVAWNEEAISRFLAQ